MTPVEGIDDGTTGFGVRGGSSQTNGVGVLGGSDHGPGVVGRSTDRSGVVGISGAKPEQPDQAGVYGGSDPETNVFAETGVWGRSDPAEGGFEEGWGVYGECTGEGYGVYGASESGPGVYGTSTSGPAGKFEGDVEITGDVRVAKDVFLTGADCSEDFDISGDESIDSGTVMVIDKEGSLRASQHPYDKKVAGVVSGAGDFRPGLVLDRQEPRENRVPVALMGKVECKVDAQYSPVEVGDLLTTSPTPGHAMKADDPLKAFGAVIGKALRPLKSGRELIPVLIALQ